MTANETRIIPFLTRFFAPELRALRGQMPLGTVFWGYGVAASLWLGVLHALALTGGHLAQQQMLIVVSAVYTGGLLVAIWRASAHASPFWADLARLLTVAWGINAAFVLMFLEIELILGYLRC